jgi:hypothetical protein
MGRGKFMPENGKILIAPLTVNVTSDDEANFGLVEGIQKQTDGRVCRMSQDIPMIIGCLSTGC